MARAGYVPERGDFVRVVLDPRVGREQSGERPALVLTPRRFNELTGYAFVAPITGTARGWPFEVPVPTGGDYKARYVRLLAKAPNGLVGTVLDRVAEILEP
jgi:mRNA interferase MazF